MTLQQLEAQILSYLVSLLKTNAQGFAQVAMADLAALVDNFIPEALTNSLISSLVSVLESDGVVIVQELLDDLAAAINAIIPASAEAPEHHKWTAVHGLIATKNPAAIAAAAVVVEKYKAKAGIKAIEEPITIVMIERQLLALLVSILKSYEQGMAQTIIADIVALIDLYMPPSILSGLIQYVIGMLQTDGVNAVQALIDELANQIAASTPTVMKVEKYTWAEIRAALVAKPELLPGAASIIAKYTK
jgi:hypothetical protein